MQAHERVAVLHAVGMQAAGGGVPGRPRPNGIAGNFGSAAAQFRHAKNPVDVGERSAQVVSERGAGRDQVFDGAGEIDMGIAGRHPGGGDADTVLLERHRHGDVQRHGPVTATCEVERLHGEIAAIARPGLLVQEPGVQVAAARIEWNAAARFDLEHSVLQLEAANRQVEDGLRGGAPAADLGRRQVGAAVGIDGQVDARLDHFEVPNVDAALENRDNLQTHGDGSGAEQRRLAGGLRAVDGERADLGAKPLPIELKRAGFDAAAGGRLHRAHHPLTHLFVEPGAAEHQDGSHDDDESEGREPARCDPRDAPARHWSTSSWNTISVWLRASLSQVSICRSARWPVRVCSIWSR